MSWRSALHLALCLPLLESQTATKNVMHTCSMIALQVRHHFLVTQQNTRWVSTFSIWAHFQSKWWVSTRQYKECVRVWNSHSKSWVKINYGQHICRVSPLYVKMISLTVLSNWLQSMLTCSMISCRRTNRNKTTSWYRSISTSFLYGNSDGVNICRSQSLCLPPIRSESHFIWN